MNRIDHEIQLLIDAAHSGELPGYPTADSKLTFYSQAPVENKFTEYFSGENDALERSLKSLWANDVEMQKNIPLILAAVEKNRAQKDSSVVRTELYNYTM